jgi:hypothetical protein
MSQSFTVNGNTYTWPDQFLGYGYVGVWPNMIDDCVAQFATDIAAGADQVSAASASAAAAAASATTATTAAATQSTSTTSLTIALGTQTLTVQTGKNFANGMPFRIAKSDGSLNFMDGNVTSYNSGTGALVGNITQITGSGTAASWNVFLEGPIPSVNLGGGAAVFSGASSFALVASSPRAQNVAFTAQGQSVTLPDATTCTLGGPIFSIANAGQYAFAVRRNDGSILTVIPPSGAADVYLDANGIAKGTWHANGQGLLSGLIYTPANSLGTVTPAATNGFWQCGNTIVLLGGTSGNLYAQAIDVSQQPCVVGPAVLVSSAFSGTNFSTLLAAAVVDSTHLLVGFQNVSGSAITGVVLTLSGSAISVSGASTLAAVSAPGTIASIIALSSTLAVALYTTGSNCYTVAIALSAGAISSAGSPVALTNSTSNIASTQPYSNNYTAGTAPLLPLSATSFIASSGSATNYVQAGSISGTTISLGTAVNSASTSALYAGLLALGGNAFLLVGYTSGSYQTFTALTVSGTVITAGSVYTDNHYTGAPPIAVAAFSPTSVGVILSGSYAMVLSISGTTVTQAVAPASIAAANQQNLIIQASQIVTWLGPTGSGSTDLMQYSVLTASGATNFNLRMPLPPGVVSNMTPFSAGLFAFSGSNTQYNPTGMAANSAVLGYKFNGTTPQFTGVISGSQVANGGLTKFWPLSATEILINNSGGTAQIMEMAA